jgi:hypothetical protein
VSTHVTNTDGYAAFAGVPKGVPVAVAVSGDGWTPYTGVYTFHAPNQDVPLSLRRIAAPRRPQDRLLRVRGNFCNLLTNGTLIFDPYLASIPASARADWLARHRQAGTTHLAISPSCAYGGAEARGYPAFDWLADPDRFVAYVRSLLAEPSADGYGFTPIILLDSGDPGYESRMMHWQAIRDRLGADAADVIVVPGWELIRASSWDSAAMSRALELLGSQGWPHIGVHLSVERGSFASNPVEPTDPWQGHESACWKSHGGQHAEIFFYQATAFTGSLDWLNRWDDIVPRFCQGLNGWRPMALCLFETVAYGAWHGQIADPEAEAKRMATAGRDWARDHYGVTDISYGNGEPD